MPEGCAPGTPGCETAFETELYETTLEDLWAGVPLETPYLTLPRSGVTSVSVTKSGVLYLGFGDRSEVLFGPLGGGLTPIAATSSRTSSRLLALNPEASETLQLAVADISGPGALEGWGTDGWRPLGDPELAQGPCVSRGGLQDSGLSWTQDGGLLFMPYGVGVPPGGALDAMSSPDGLFRVRGDSTEWLRPGHDLDECLEELSFSSTLGPLVSTHSGLVLHESSAGWVNPAPLTRAGLTLVQRDRSALADFPGGYAYGGAEGVFGYAVDGVLCHESLIGTNRIEALSWSGATMLATGSKPGNGRLTIYLIRFEPPEAGPI